MNVYARTQARRMISLVDKLGEVYKPENKCAEYLRHLKKANGIGDKPMPQLKLTIPEPWWRRRDSNTLLDNHLQLNVYYTLTTHSLQFPALEGVYEER